MNYDRDDDGRLIRVCTPCLEDTPADNNYVLEEHHEQTACIYCGSYDTVEQAPKWLWFKCNSCGETFRRI